MPKVPGRPHRVPRRTCSSSSLFRLLVICFLAASIQRLPSVVALTNAPVSIPEELGCSPTLTVLYTASTAATLGTAEPFYFDPLNLARDDNFARYREAELKHGRLAMLSVVLLSGRYYYDTTSNGYDEKTGGGGLPMPSIYKVVFENDHWSVVDWIKFTVFCGLLESLVYVQINPTDMPGDYGWGYFGERNKGKHERSLVCELENGRLAMMTVLFYLGNDYWQQFGSQQQGLPFSGFMSKVLSVFQQSQPGV